MHGSRINPLLTLSYMQREHENKYFDRKSAKVKPADLGELLCAFANAEGGCAVIGISDTKRRLEGINGVGEDKINELLNAPKTCCKPMPVYEEEFVPIINCRGIPDRLLLLHIHASVDEVIRTSNDSTFLRIGDKTREIKGDDLRRLEYAKNTRHFEDEISRASLAQADGELVARYKKLIGAGNLPTAQVFRARGLMDQESEYLTNAGMLLFAKNVMAFYPNCRVRFVRYEGNKAESGTRLNITKDVNFDEPILKLINRAISFVRTQLREFTALDPETGKFRTVPEYPEFAWQEGIVNAITHREYGLAGNYILISMFDNRLEIQSPGALPDLVTVQNIRDTRFARNPRISRVLTEFGWGRELNEGVKRIYADMAEYFLEEPEYRDVNQRVQLILRNNIVMRHIRRKESAAHFVGEDHWQELDELEKEILAYMGSHNRVSRKELESVTGKATRTISKRLNHLISLHMVKRNGSLRDPHQTYEMIAG